MAFVSSSITGYERNVVFLMGATLALLTFPFLVRAVYLHIRGTHVVENGVEVKYRMPRVYRGYFVLITLIWLLSVIAVFPMFLGIAKPYSVHCPKACACARTS